LATLYAIDIVNPFAKTVNFDKLRELIERVQNPKTYEKLGELHHEISNDLKDEGTPNIISVVEFLECIDSLNVDFIFTKPLAQEP